MDALPVRRGGGLTYVQSQLTALADVAPDLELHTLVSPWSGLQDLPGTTQTVHVRSVAQRFGYEIASLPFRPADVLYCPANFGPIFGRTPMVLTIQNANYYRSGLALPETAPSRPRWKLWANYAAMRHASAVVAISQSVADDAAATVPAAAGKLQVIPSGAPRWNAPEAPLPGLPDAYFLTLASESPHKRVEDVVRGWARAREVTPELPALVIVGGISAAQAAACRAAAGPHTGLHMTGRVIDRGQLRWAYQRASAMVSMSVLEAFPLTPAEAGSLGCPLILSDIPPHREVTAGNAVFVAPGDSDALAAALGAASGWEPASRRWSWPVSWADNALRLRGVFDRVLSDRT